jgi:formylglycine-generating enzyme required for sulfatase activity
MKLVRRIIFLVLLIGTGRTFAADQAPGSTMVVDVYGAPLEMVWIPAGKFMMGSPESENARVGNEGPRHEVTISRGFWMSKYEITQAQWEKMPPGKNPSSVKNPGNPVESVSWESCRNFVDELNNRARGTNYHLEFRLPTEAQWEYACRAGTTTAFHYGDSLDATQANFDGNYPGGQGAKGEYRKKPLPAGQFKPNAWGLYDMHGNVSEWCLDYGYGVYGNEAVTDPKGPKTGCVRVVRGGAWHNPGASCRSAFRNYNSVTTRTPFIGLRVVLMAKTDPGSGNLKADDKPVPAGK